jgi:hypothetical protein
MAEQAFSRLRFGLDRRGRLYLGGTAVAVLVLGLLAGAVAYAALAAAAIGAWLTRQQALVRWTLSILAGVLIAGLILGLAVGGTGSATHGGPVSPVPRP